MAWDVIVVNRDGSRVKELVEAKVQSVSWMLNDIGTAEIEIPTLDSAGAAVQLVKREIQLWWDGELRWWGVPWRRQWTAGTTSIGCDDLMSYFNRRFITHMSLDFDDVEQFSIAWSLISHVQQLTYGDLGITADFAPSGILRLRRYERSDHENILDLLQEFPALDRGFDWSVVVDGTGLRRWTPHYPRKGVVRNNIVLEYGRNIVDFNINEDAIGIVNHAYVTGGTSGDVRFEENYRDDLLAAEYGLMHDVLSEGSQNDVAWLLDKAKREVEERGVPVITPELTSVNVPVQLFGVVDTGDEIRVRIHHGALNLDDMYRIGGITWQAPDLLKLVIMGTNT